MTHLTPAVVRRRSLKKERELASFRKPPSLHGIRLRNCMCCRRPFKSDGHGNRLCVECRHKSEYP